MQKFAPSALAPQSVEPGGLQLAVQQEEIIREKLSPGTQLQMFYQVIY